MIGCEHNCSVIQLTAQKNDAASYSIWLSPDDQFVDWSQSSDAVIRRINALGFPYSGAKTRCANVQLTVCDPIPEVNLNFEHRQPGKIWRIVDGDPIVLTGDGLLRVRLTDEKGERPELSLRTRFR